MAGIDGLVLDINKFGYVRVAAAVPRVFVGDVFRNVTEVVALANKAAHWGVDILCFPELSLTGYTCKDLFLQTRLLDDAQIGLDDFCKGTEYLPLVSIVGLPFRLNGSRPYNVAAVCYKGRIQALIPKSYLPNYGEFEEERWFSPALGLPTGIKVSYQDLNIPFGTDLIINIPALCCSFGVEICEDAWMPIKPSALASANGAQIIFNLSASSELVGKEDYRRSLVGQASGDLICGYVYTSAGPSESTSGTVFGGHCLIYENGSLLAEKLPLSADDLLITEIDVNKLDFERRRSNTWAQSHKYWSTLFNYRHVCLDFIHSQRSRRYSLTRNIDQYPFIPTDEATLNKRCRQILNIQTIGLERRLAATQQATNKKVVLGISGGRDSILALLCTVGAFDSLNWDRRGIQAITLPGPGTTKETYSVATDLAKTLGVSFSEQKIEETAASILRGVGHEPCWQCLQCENVQARVRTNFIMTLGFMVGTGDMSELFKGWCTYAGDQTSMYNPNCGVPKTLVNFLIKQIVNDDLFGKKVSAVLERALVLEITPELIATANEVIQKTEDKIGPFVLIDFFMRAIVRDGFSPKKVFYLANLAFQGVYEPSVILRWLRDTYQRFFSSQFKRQTAPDGPKVGTLSLDPRGDWRMPADISLPLSYATELDQLEGLLANNQ